MAVYHCRCAFLWFFLLHKQKKEQKVINILLSFLCLDTKKRNKRKIKDKRIAPPVCPANAHEQSFYFVITSYYRTDRSKLLLRVARNSWRRSSRLAFFKAEVYLSSGGKGAGKFLQLNKEIYNYRRCR
jgi:hypothetical protein